MKYLINRSSATPPEPSPSRSLQALRLAFFTSVASADALCFRCRSPPHPGLLQTQAALFRENLPLLLVSSLSVVASMTLGFPLLERSSSLTQVPHSACYPHPALCFPSSLIALHSLLFLPIFMISISLKPLHLLSLTSSPPSPRSLLFLPLLYPQRPLPSSQPLTQLTPSDLLTSQSLVLLSKMASFPVLPPPSLFS